MKHARATWLPRAAIGALAVLLAGQAAAQDWPAWRRDGRRTARQTLPGDIAEPAVQWAFPIGGNLPSSQFLAGDVDLDGALEIVLLRGGRVVARRFDGTLVWTTEALGITWVTALFDFDGDGRPEVFTASWSTGVFVLDGRTGSVLWRTPPDSGLRYLPPVPVDADRDGRLELYVPYHGCGSGGRWAADVYSFPAGWAGAVPVALDLTDHDAWCGGGVPGDLEGDGLPEIVTLGWANVVAYDPRTGEPAYTSASIGDLPWGIGDITTADVDGDARHEIVIATDYPGGTSSMRRLLLVEVEGGTLALRWSVVADLLGVHRFPRSPVADLVPGGPLEIATSLFDPASGRWRLLVFEGDAATAEPALEIADRALLALADVNADGAAELLVRDASSSDLGGFGTVRALAVTADGAWTTTELWHRDDVVLPVAPAPWGLGEGVAVLPAGSPATPEVLLFRDGDADGLADTILGVPASGAPDASRLLGTYRVPVGLRACGEGAAARAVLTASDGAIDLLDPALALVNDARPPLGEADLAELNLAAPTATVQVASTADGPRLVAIDGSRRLLVADPRTAGTLVPPEVVWRGEDVAVPEGGTVVVPGPDGRPQVLADVRQPGGTLELVARLVEDGEEAARVALAATHDDSPFGAAVPLGRGATLPPRLVQAVYDRIADYVDYLAVDPWDDSTFTLDIGRAGMSVYDGGGALTGSAWDLTGDGVDDVYWDQGYLGCRIVDGATGTTVSSPSCPYHGLFAFVDMDGDDVVDVLHSAGPLGGPARYEADLSPVWAVEDPAGHGLAAVAPAGGGAYRVASARLTSAFLHIYDAADGSLVVSEVLAGGAAWADEEEARAAGVVVGVLSALVAADDVTGSGGSSFLAGSTDGRLYAVSADDGAVQWTVDFRAQVGEPLVADVDDDGRSEVVVPVGDGHVYAVGPQELAAPAEVWDTDGTFDATSAADDLDEVPSSTTAGANWPESPGATGYEYQILTADGVVVVPWTDVGAARRFARSDLALQLGRTYRTAVRARSDEDGPRTSAETVSDGFVVVDTDDPVVAVSADPAGIFPEGPSGPPSSSIAYSARDAVGLQGFDLEVNDAEGTLVRRLAGAAVGGVALDGETEWDGRDDEGVVVPSGDYVVLLTVRDVADHESTAQASIHVCGPADPDERCAGGEPGGDGGGDGGEAEDVPAEADAGDAAEAEGGEAAGDEGEAGWRAEGTGCTCALGTARRSGGAAALLFVLAAFGGALLRRRRREDPRA